MADITQVAVYESLTGEQTLAVYDSLSQHTIHIAGATGDVTVTVVPKGFSNSEARNPGEAGENVVPANGMIQVDAGSLSFIVLSPADTGASYNVSVSSQ